MIWPLQNRVVVITGASAGIGRAISLALAAQGARCFLVSNVPSELAEVAKMTGGRWMEADLSRPDEVRAIVPAAERELGPVDGLINNAGIGLHATFLDTPEEDLRRLFEVNFFSAAALAREALRGMMARGRGHIVFVSSLSGRRALARMGAYASSKGAIHILSQVLRLEAARAGVHVSEILPISVRTGFFEAAQNRSERPYRPGGLVLTPEQVAASVVSCLQRPRAEVYPSFLSRLAPAVDGLFPNLTARVLELFGLGAERGRVERPE